MKHRTAFLTAATVALVLVAGSAAIAANVGILNASTPVLGNLTVAAGAAGGRGQTSSSPTLPPQIVTVPDTAPAVTATVQPAPDLSSYEVGGAGVVTLERQGDLLRIADVRADAGWQWVPLGEGALVQVGFLDRDGSILGFLAAVLDGSIVTRVDDLTPIKPARGVGHEGGVPGDDDD